ncbi:MAG TPA: M2 family metallopeptidase, partial [Steroidobacteraceae bacterium]|nr:M2 family metallopeptidase [Steroidobacteraceae bacterium]
EEPADEFIARISDELRALADELNAAGWAYSTYITPDTELLNAKASERFLAHYSTVVDASKGYQTSALDPRTARAFSQLRLGVETPAPKDPARLAEFTQITTRLEGMYGAGKYCPQGPESCRSLNELERTLADSRDYDALTEAWTGWHSVARPMRADYARLIELANEGARDLGYEDMSVHWRAGYDMSPQQFSAETERLWSQVKPLYDQLHCYTRGKLAQQYGNDKVPARQPIPAQLLGNMWSQQWGEIYDLVEPYPGVAAPDLDAALKEQGYDAVKMTRSAEDFYTSIGFPALPESFWQRSMLTKPRDRDVVCHASAWHMDGKEDVRIKMCIEPTQEQLFTIYHELGHIYYDLWYKDQPILFQAGAHDGFHEAIGDTINLSMTPAYLTKIGLAPATPPSREAVVNNQMRLALDKIAFLPFGKLIDDWRWQVFSGKISPAEYNASWWKLRTAYQGVAPPVARSEVDFDPGAKYHIPANRPYMRYFLADILQFQLHKALCDAAGFTGPLHECSIYGNREVGARFGAMLAAGSSQPWPDTLERLTGTRQMDAAAIIEYFQPLMSYLEEQNKGQQCGW